MIPPGLRYVGFIGLGLFANAVGYVILLGNVDGMIAAGVSSSLMLGVLAFYEANRD